MDLAMSGDFEAYENIGVIPFSVSFSPILYPDLVEPISLSVVRLGWITVVDNTTDINFSSNETVKQVKLTKYREGFLYNTLLPQEELSKIDLFTPLNSSYITSPTPSATPPPDEAPAIMFIPVGVGIGAVAAVAIIVIFLRIRK